jgi:integrase
LTKRGSFVGAFLLLGSLDAVTENEGNTMETLETFFDKYGKRLWHDKYLKDCNFMVNRLSNFANNRTRAIGSYTDDDLYDFMDYLKEEGLSDSTVNRYLAAYSRLFKKAVNKKLMSYTPKVEWKAIEPGRPRFYTDQEVDDLVEFFLDSDHPWMADFVIFALNTGMRLGEILSINRPKPKKTIGTISPCGSYIDLKNTKNGSERTVPMNASAKEALRNLDNCPSGPWTNRKFYDTWKAAKECLAPGDDHFVFHVLRHTCATRLAMEFSVDTLIVGTILGHKSIATTKKYVHAKKENLATIMSKLEKRAA